MFKIKKNINENNIKKDFFKVNKAGSKKPIINANNIFKSNCSFNEIFTNVRNFNKVFLPDKNFFNVIITEKAISIFDFLDLITDEILEIYLFATKINKKNLAKIDSLKHKTTIITDVFFDEIDSFKHKIICHTHVKGLLIKTNKNHFLFLGSGNPSINARIEQYFIFNEESLFFKFKKDIC